MFYYSEAWKLNSTGNNSIENRVISYVSAMVSRRTDYAL